MRPRVLQMLEHRLRFVLRQHVNGGDVGVHEITEDEVDETISAAERHRGLGAVTRERIEALPKLSHRVRDAPCGRVSRISKTCAPASLAATTRRSPRTS